MGPGGEIIMNIYSVLTMFGIMNCVFGKGAGSTKSMNQRLSKFQVKATFFVTIFIAFVDFVLVLQI